MKNNKVLTEVSRIHELMGKPLIIEQWDDVVKNVLSKVTKMVRVGDNVVDNLVSQLKSATNEEDAMRIIARLVKSSDEIASIVIPKVMSSLSKIEIGEINKLKNYLKTQIKNKTITNEFANKMADNWVDANVTSQFDGVVDVIKKDVKDFILSTTKQVDGTSPISKPKPKTITDVAGQTMDDVIPLTNNELLKLEKLYRQKGLGSSFFKAMRQFSKQVIDMMTSQTKLMDETLSLIKTYQKTDNAAAKTDILKRISDNVKKLTQSDTTNKQIIDEWIDTNVLDYKIKSKIKDTDGYKKAASILDGTSFNTWNQTYKSMSDRRKSSIKQVNSMVNPLSWLPANMKKWGESTGYGAQVYNKWKSFVTGSEFQELRNYIATGQTQKWSGINSFRKEFGVLPAMANVTKEWAYSYVVLSLVYGFLDYTSDVIGHYLDDYEIFKDTVWIQKNSKEYDEVTQGREKEIGGNFIEGWGYFFKDLSSYMLKYIKQIEVAIPGLILDDLGSILYDMSTGDVTPEEAKKLEERLKLLKEKVKTEKKEIENGTKKTIDTVKTKITPVIDKTKEVIDDKKISIELDIQPVAPCLFTGGWSVDLVITDKGVPSYVTHNTDWSQKYYLDVTKKNNITTVYYQGTKDLPC